MQRYSNILTVDIEHRCRHGVGQRRYIRRIVVLNESVSGEVDKQVERLVGHETRRIYGESSPHWCRGRRRCPPEVLWSGPGQSRCYVALIIDVAFHGVVLILYDESIRWNVGRAVRRSNWKKHENRIGAESLHLTTLSERHLLNWQQT